MILDILKFSLSGGWWHFTGCFSILFLGVAFMEHVTILCLRGLVAIAYKIRTLPKPGDIK